MPHAHRIAVVDRARSTGVRAVVDAVLTTRDRDGRGGVDARYGDDIRGDGGAQGHIGLIDEAECVRRGVDGARGYLNIHAVARRQASIVGSSDGKGEGFVGSGGSKAGRGAVGIVQTYGRACGLGPLPRSGRVVDIVTDIGRQGDVGAAGNRLVAARIHAGRGAYRDDGLVTVQQTRATGRGRAIVAGARGEGARRGLQFGRDPRGGFRLAGIGHQVAARSLVGGQHQGDDPRNVRSRHAGAAFIIGDMIRRYGSATVVRRNNIHAGGSNLHFFTVIAETGARAGRGIHGRHGDHVVAIGRSMVEHVIIRITGSNHHNGASDNSCVNYILHGW